MKLWAHKETEPIGELLLDALWRKDIETLKTLLSDSRFHKKSLTQNLSQGLHEKIEGMLHEAIRENDLETFKILLSCVGYLEGLVHYAIRRGNDAVLKYLLENFKNKANEEFCGDKPLDFASTPEIVEVLLIHGADPNQSRLNGINLDFEKWQTDPEQEDRRIMQILQLLLVHGARGEGLMCRVACNLGCPGDITISERGYVTFEKIISQLTSLGVDINAFENGQSPLHIAAEHNFNGIAKLLFLHGADIGLVAESGLTPLDVAHKNRRISLFSEPELPQQIAHQDVQKARFEHLFARLAQGASPDKLLLAACRFGDYSFLQPLLDRGADIRRIAADGSLALRYITHPAIINFLFTHGASLRNAAGATLLPEYPVYTDWLICDPQREVARAIGLIETFLKHGAGINDTDEDGMTILHLLMTSCVFKKIPFQTVALAYKQIVRRVLALGADVHARDNYGFTPLHLIKSYDVCTQVLLDHKADIDAENIDGITPLIAVLLWCDFEEYLTNGGQEQLKLLITLGADVNHRDHNGMTVLHYASRLKIDDEFDYDDDCVKFIQAVKEAILLLLESGADLYAVDNNGKTALDIASEQGLDASARLLREFALSPSSSGGIRNPAILNSKPSQAKIRVGKDFVLIYFGAFTLRLRFFLISLYITAARM